jgi:hypothetical protein
VLFRSGSDEVEPILEEKMKVGKFTQKRKYFAVKFRHNIPIFHSFGEI